MPHTHVVTGVASGIGRALTERLLRDNQRGIGVDLRSITSAPSPRSMVCGSCSAPHWLPEPRWAASPAIIEPVDDRLFASPLDSDEARHCSWPVNWQQLPGSSAGNTVYNTSKRAIAHWLRENAPAARWAGVSVSLSAGAPAPLNGPAAPASAPAELLAWLVKRREHQHDRSGPVH